MGLPTGCEPYGNGVPVIVSGRESLLHGEGEQVVRIDRYREVCKVQNAETVLSIIRERGERGLALENVYRMLYNPNLYLRAYSKLYTNQGAMTPGITEETVDGMSIQKIEQLIDDIRQERFRWTPVRRIYISKKNTTKMRPLGIPAWKDKLLQEVIRSILEAYYETQFSDRSHGFRPEHGCHTALREIQTSWTGTRWFIEGDISQYFDTINHDNLITIMAEKVHDSRFMRLIKHLLKSGYMEEWKYNKTFSGVPQGGVLSPLLSNIYLDKLDQYVEKTLIPQYTRGSQRKQNPAYKSLTAKIHRARKQGKRDAVKILHKQRQQLPSLNSNDSTYRRLHYTRYADDFLLGFSGSRNEAEEIKQQIGNFLHSTLNLELSEAKTLITSATKQAATFLGYEIETQIANDKHDQTGRRSVNGRIGLRLPRITIEEKCRRYMQKNKPVHRPELLLDTDYSIVARYQQEYCGIVQYYRLATNVSSLWKLHWVMQTSLLKTLAAKHRTSTTKIAKKYRNKTVASDGTTHVCLRVKIERAGKKPLIAQFGGLSLKRQPWATLDDKQPPQRRGTVELLQRLLAEECELCGSQTNIQVHHIRRLADLKTKRGRERPKWVKRMAARQRKTLVVCRECHNNIHAGRPTQQKVSE